MIFWDCWRISVSSYRTHTPAQRPSSVPTSASASASMHHHYKLVVIFWRSKLTLQITSKDWMEWLRWQLLKQTHKNGLYRFIFFVIVIAGSVAGWHGRKNFSLFFLFFMSLLLPLIWFNDLKNHTKKTWNRLHLVWRQCLSSSPQSSPLPSYANLMSDKRKSA